MKKSVIIITSFLSVICLTLMMSNVRALSIYDPNNDNYIEVPDIPSSVPSNYSRDNYIITSTSNTIYLLLVKNNTKVYYYFPSQSRLDSLSGTGGSSQFCYYTLNNNNWSNTCSTSSGFWFNFLGTSVDIYASSSYTDIKYEAGYGLVDFPFIISYQQGEVVIPNYNNVSANLVSQTINLKDSNININDYHFYYTLESTGIKEEYIPDSESNYFYYNIPLAYNTNILFTIEDLEYNIIYSNNYNAYLDILPNTSGMRIYELNNYKYANISGINSGSFCLTNPLSYFDNNNLSDSTYNIYVSTMDSGAKINFINSTYNTSSELINDSYCYNFDFNNESDKYITIYINGDMWNYKDALPLYLSAPSSAYVHLSGLPNSKDSQLNPVNQQSYIDGSGNLHYIENPILFIGEEDSNFYDSSNNVISYVLDKASGVTNIFTSMLENLSTPILYTIYACFSLVLITIIINLFKH